MARNRSVDLEERRRHAEAFVRALPLVPRYGPPLSDEERAGIQASLQHFTARCGKRRHGHVLWVRSPGEFDCSPGAGVPCCTDAIASPAGSPPSATPRSARDTYSCG